MSVWRWVANSFSANLWYSSVFMIWKPCWCRPDAVEKRQWWAKRIAGVRLPYDDWRRANGQFFSCRLFFSRGSNVSVETQSSYRIHRKWILNSFSFLRKLDRLTKSNTANWIDLWDESEIVFNYSWKKVTVFSFKIQFIDEKLSGVPSSAALL